MMPVVWLSGSLLPAEEEQTLLHKPLHLGKQCVLCDLWVPPTLLQKVNYHVIASSGVPNSFCLFLSLMLASCLFLKCSTGHLAAASALLIWGPFLMAWLTTNWSVWPAHRCESCHSSIIMYNSLVTAQHLSVLTSTA